MSSSSSSEVQEERAAPAAGSPISTSSKALSGGQEQSQMTTHRQPFSLGSTIMCKQPSESPISAMLDSRSRSGSSCDGSDGFARNKSLLDSLTSSSCETTASHSREQPCLSRADTDFSAVHRSTQTTPMREDGSFRATDEMKCMLRLQPSRSAPSYSVIPPMEKPMLSQLMGEDDLLQVTPESFALSTSEQPSNVALQLSLIWEQLFIQPARPFGMLIRSFNLPTQDDYLFRMLVNLFYYARNYANIVCIMLIVFCVFDPVCVVLLANAGIVHFLGRQQSLNKKANATTKLATSNSHCGDKDDHSEGEGRGEVPGACFWVIRLLKVVQLGLCVGLVYWMGVLRIVGVSISLFVPIIAHAYFSPYTDDAFHLYHEVTRRNGIHVAAPRSPTEGFSNVDPSFENALLSPHAPLKKLSRPISHSD